MNFLKNLLKFIFSIMLKHEYTSFNEHNERMEKRRRKSKFER